MLAMQDALDEVKFQLFLTLIQKTADDAIVRQKNEKGQNLFHILAKNSNDNVTHHPVIARIYKTLKARGVDCLECDKHGNNALHFAVKQKAVEVVRMLICDNIKVN
jgi:ankyrin repeat protein